MFLYFASLTMNQQKLSSPNYAPTVKEINKALIFFIARNRINRNGFFPLFSLPQH
jgi:hypothetical protein